MRRAALRSALCWQWTVLALVGPASALGHPPEEAPKNEKPSGKDEKPAVKGKSKASKEIDWLTLDQGLARVRDKYLPVLLFFDGRPLPPKKDEAGDSKTPSRDVPSFEETLADSTMKEVLKHFVLVRVAASDLTRPYIAPRGPAEPPEKEEGKGKDAPGHEKKQKGSPEGGGGGVKDPSGEGQPTQESPRPSGGLPSLGEKFGLSEGRSSLVSLSFREEEVLRYDRELPARYKLKRELTRVWQVNEIYAREARRVEGDLSASRYAYRLSNFREAVLKVKPMEGKKAQELMDPVLKKRVNEVIQEYRAKANEAISEADKLDREKKYTEAISAFDAVVKNFPFLDVMQHANKRKGEILRKMTFGG